MERPSPRPDTARSLEAPRIAIFAMALLGSALLAPSRGAAQEDGGRHFDCRLRQNAGVLTAPLATGKAEEEAVRRRMPDLRIEYDPTTGVASSVYNMPGALSDPGRGDDLVAIALE